MAGRNRALILAARSETSRIASASRPSLPACTPCAPNPFTTRTPDTDSSTTVASAACLAWTAITAGWILWLNRRAETLTKGSGANAMTASSGSLLSSRIRIATSWNRLLIVNGIITTNACNCCRSLDARLISCPVWA